MRFYTATVFLLLAGLFTISQTIFLLYSPAPDPMISSWAHDYRWSSSIKGYGFSASLVVCAAILLLRPSRTIYLISLLLMCLVAWHYMVSELWRYFVTFPKLFSTAGVSIPLYFSFTQPVATTLRLVWHILIPIGLFVSLVLFFKKKDSEQSDAPNGYP